MMMREKLGFIENTAMRHRRGGGGEVTVTSRLTDRFQTWVAKQNGIHCTSDNMLFPRNIGGGIKEEEGEACGQPDGLTTR